jgi:hypothetical protein
MTKYGSLGRKYPVGYLQFKKCTVDKYCRYIPFFSDVHPSLRERSYRKIQNGCMEHSSS